jgi:hypothetical protein
MGEMRDFRLTGYEDHLRGLALMFKFFRPSPQKDHVHCWFCTKKFQKRKDGGMSTPDEKYWICLRCFTDFRDTFRWVVQRYRYRLSHKVPLSDIRRYDKRSQFFYAAFQRAKRQAFSTPMDSSAGFWFDPGTGKSYHPDVNHNPPHYDFRLKDSIWYKWYKDGRVEP